MSWLSAEEEKM